MPDSPILDDRQMNFQLGDIYDVTNPLYSSLPADEVTKLAALEIKVRIWAIFIRFLVTAAGLGLCVYVTGWVFNDYAFTRNHLVLCSLGFDLTMVLAVLPFTYGLIGSFFCFAVDTSSHKELVRNHLHRMNSEDGIRFMENVKKEVNASKERTGSGRTFAPYSARLPKDSIFCTIYRNSRGQFGARVVSSSIPGTMSCGFSKKAPENLASIMSSVHGLSYESAASKGLDMGAVNLEWFTDGDFEAATLLFNPCSSLMIDGKPSRSCKQEIVLATLIMGKDKRRALVVVPVGEGSVHATAMSLEDFTLGGTIVIHKGDVPPESEWSV